MHHQAPSSRPRRLLLLAALALLALALAAPASAAANTTSLTLVASPEVIPYGGVAVLTGTLMDTTDVPVAVGGQAVYVWGSPTGTFPGSLLAIVTTGDATPAYDTGTYTLPVCPVDKTYYQMTFLATGAYEACSSNVVSVTPKVYLSKPRVPASVQAKRKFKVTVYLAPRHTAGAKNAVKVKAYRSQAGKWVLKRTLWMKNANFLKMTKCTARFSLKEKGTYRVRAYAPADGKHAKTVSPWSRVFTVT